MLNVFFFTNYYATIIDIHFMVNNLCLFWAKTGHTKKYSFSLRKQNASASFFKLFFIDINILVRIQLDQQSKPALW